MAVATSTAILGTLAVAGAASSIIGGNASAKSAKRMGEFDAQVYEQQASMIQEQRKLQQYQFNRGAARMRGKAISRTAGAGFMLSGSPLAMLIDNESQMLLDQAVGDYNSRVQENFAMSGAIRSRFGASEQAKLAKFTGYTNAFSTALNTGQYVHSRMGKP